MGFINQFPYSDFHELNLDWLLNKTKTLEGQIKYLEEQFAQIEILTEDTIKQMIAVAIAENNIEVYSAIAQVKNDLTAALNSLDIDITARYKAYTDAQIALQKIYIDNQDIYYYGLSKTYSDNNLNIAKAYTDNKVIDYTFMVNPITGQYDDVRNVVNDIFNNFLSNDALTAAEYDALDLTAIAYDNYELTAYEYDFNGKNLLV